MINCIISSIGDENSIQGAKRFSKEVLCYKPDVLFIDYSLNDRKHDLEKVLNNWLVYASEDETNFSEIVRGTCPASNTCFDIIADVKSEFTSIKKIKIHLDGNWNGTDNIRYFDPTDFH